MILPARRAALAALAVLALALAATAWAALALYAWAGLALLGVLLWWEWRVLRRQPLPRIDRFTPRRAVVGTAATFRYCIESRAAAPVRVELLDELPRDLGGDQSLPPVWIAPGESVEQERAIVPERRGVRPLGRLYFLHPGPLGLLLRRGHVEPQVSLPVLPQHPPRAGHGGLTDRKSLAELGVRPRRPRGDGLEFELLREYVRGDDPRHIDWRATARAGRTLVRQHQIERNHRVIVAVDTGRLMTTRIDGVSKLDWALTAMLALAEASHRSGDSVGMAAFDADLRRFVPPISPHRSLGGLLEAATQLEGSLAETSYRTLTALLQSRQRKRALVVVLTDFVEGSAGELEGYVQSLARRHCVLLVALRDRMLQSLAKPAPDIAERELFERLVLQDLEVERQTVLRRMRRAGVQTLDLDPAHVTAPVLARYLDIRQAGLL